LLTLASYPPDTDAKEKQLGDFFKTYPPPKIAGLIPDYVNAIKAKDSSISKFGLLGVCPPSSINTLKAVLTASP
jgi:hypothetical protein